MNIDLKRVKKTPDLKIHFEEFLPVPDEVAGDKRALSEFYCCGDYVYREGILRISGSGKASFAGGCDRCGAPIGFEIQADLTDKIDLDDCDYTVSAETLYFDEFLREKLIFALDGKRLCREDCKGLCQTCGKNLNAGDCGCGEIDEDNPFYALKLKIDGIKK